MTDTRIIENFTVADQDKGIEVSGHDKVIIRNGTITNTRVGMDILANGHVQIQNVTIIPGPLTDTRFAYGISFGNSGVAADANGLMECTNLTVQPLGLPSNDYATYNRDCITLEQPNGKLILRNCDLQGATDACVDAKAEIEFHNCLFGPSYQQIRVWDTNPGVVVKNCGFSPPLEPATPGGTQTMWRHKDFVGTFDTSDNYIRILDWPPQDT